MSLPYDAAAMSAVLDTIRNGTKAVTNPPLTYKNSGIEPGGKPPPRTGRIYVAVDEDSVMNEANPAQDHLKERMRIAIFVSMRTGRKAPDRTGDLYLETVAAFAPIERQIVAALHGQIEVMTALNALLEEDTQPVQEQLWYTGREKTKLETATWSSETIDPRNVTGWAVRKLKFIGFRRVQDRNSIT